MIFSLENPRWTFPAFLLSNVSNGTCCCTEELYFERQWHQKSDTCDTIFVLLSRNRSVYLLKIRNLVEFNWTATFTIFRPFDSTYKHATVSRWTFICRCLHVSLFCCKNVVTYDNEMQVKIRLVVCLITYERQLFLQI